LISRKTSRKVPTAPRSFSSKSQRDPSSSLQGDFRGHSYHNHPPHQAQQYLSSSLGSSETPRPASSSGIAASSTSIGSAGTSSPHMGYHQTLLQEHLQLTGGAMTSSYTGQSTSSASHLRGESSPNFGGSTSQLGFPAQGSLSGPASTPVGFRAEANVSATSTLPNLTAASYTPMSGAGSSTTTSSSNTYLQLPSDD
jgi:hypothetical protein